MSDLLKLLKKEAKFIAAKSLVDDGVEICHGHALDQVSESLGFKNWNTLRAIAVIDPERIEKLINDLCADDSDAALSESSDLEQEKRPGPREPQHFFGGDE